jgi:hypothetical protein
MSFICIKIGENERILNVRGAKPKKIMSKWLSIVGGT